MANIPDVEPEEYEKLKKTRLPLPCINADAPRQGHFDLGFKAPLSLVANSILICVQLMRNDVRYISKIASFPKKYYFSITMKTELVTTLKRKATKLLAELREEKEPVLITEHGKPSAYLVDVEHFEQIQKKLELLEGLARGEKAILEDRVVSNEDAKKRMQRWLK